MKLFFRAFFLLIGTIVGAGVFALPYVFSKSGALPSFFGLLFLGLVLMVLNLFYSKIVLKTPGDHQLPGYVNKYLGPNWMKFSLLSMMFALNGALLAYLILGGEFLALSVGQTSSQAYSFWFYLVGVVLFWQRFSRLTKIGAFLTALLVGLMIFVSFKLIPFVVPSNLVLLGNKPLFFWGAALFSLVGFSVIPEVEEVLRSRRKLLTPAVVAGSLVPIFLYLVFAFSIWGASGFVVTVDALSGLTVFSPGLVRVGAIIGLLALITSFLSLVNVAKEIYFRDLKLSERWAKLLAIAPGVLGIFFSTSSFINIVSFTGTISLAISGTMISLMFAKANKKLAWLAWLVILVLVFGVFSLLMDF